MCRHARKPSFLYSDAGGVHLDIKPLLELSCAKVASQIKNKSVVEIRKYFNIENDFTPEEEAQIQEENRWAEESF